MNLPQRRISEIKRGRRAISADTTVPPGRCFDMEAQFWLNPQSRYDLLQAKGRSKSAWKAKSGLMRSEPGFGFCFEYFGSNCPQPLHRRMQSMSLDNTRRTCRGPLPAPNERRGVLALVVLDPADPDAAFRPHAVSAPGAEEREFTGLYAGRFGSPATPSPTGVDRCVARLCGRWSQQNRNR